MASADRTQLLDVQHDQAQVRRHRSLLTHWLGRWFRAPRAATLEPLPLVEPGQLGVTFGGHATVLLRYHQVQLVNDPMLGRWVGGVRRAIEPGLAPSDLAEVDIALIGNRHRDHLHLPTLAQLPRRATIVLPPGGHRAVSRMGFARVVELAPGTDIDIRGVNVLAVGQARGDGGQAYLVRGDGPSTLVAGDGGYGPELAELGRHTPPDLALLPIGGYCPRSFRARHSSPLDALASFEDLRARLLIPIRHGAFALSYERLDEPARWLRELVTARGLERYVCQLHAGQSEVLVQPGGAPALTSSEPSVTTGSSSSGVQASAAPRGTAPARVVAEISAAARARLAGPWA